MQAIGRVTSESLWRLFGVFDSNPRVASYTLVIGKW